MSISKNGHAISTLEDWEKYAGPKGKERQWKEYRSALELARAWVAALPAMPPEVSEILASDPAFAPVTTWSAEPEARIRFDALAGEPRNSDLLMEATDRFGHFSTAVEGKADESFGESVSAAAKAAERRRATNDRSRGSERITALCRALFDTTLKEDQALGTLRYQLLTATAGALAAAVRMKADRAVLLVQEFASAKTSTQKHDANSAALNAFVSRNPSAPIMVA